MKKVTRINPDMFNLLIEKGMDNFTVVEARDALLKGTSTFSNRDDARKYIYKQLLSFEEKGWLSVTGTRRDKRYHQTNDFKALMIEPRTPGKTKASEGSVTDESLDYSLNRLEQEKKQHQGELAITLGEIEEYQSLLMRFPNNKQDIQPLFNSARERSAKLLGRINALTNWMQIAQRKASQC